MRHLGHVFLLGFAMLFLGGMLAMSFVVELEFPLIQSVFALLLLVWGSQLVAAALAEHHRRHELRH